MEAMQRLTGESGIMQARSIREYAESMPVAIRKRGERWVIDALNEGGYNGTEVDLVDVINFVKKYKPELLKETERS